MFGDRLLCRSCCEASCCCFWFDDAVDEEMMGSARLRIDSGFVVCCARSDESVAAGSGVVISRNGCVVFEIGSACPDVLNVSNPFFPSLQAEDRLASDEFVVLPDFAKVNYIVESQTSGCGTVNMMPGRTMFRDF